MEMFLERMVMPALALLIVGIEDAFFHLLVLAEDVGSPQKTVYESGLAVVDVAMIATLRMFSCFMNLLSVRFWAQKL